MSYSVLQKIIFQASVSHLEALLLNPIKALLRA